MVAWRGLNLLDSYFGLPLVPTYIYLSTWIPLSPWCDLDLLSRSSILYIATFCPLSHPLLCAWSLYLVPSVLLELSCRRRYTQTFEPTPLSSLVHLCRPTLYVLTAVFHQSLYPSAFNATTFSLCSPLPAATNDLGRTGPQTR